MQLAKMVECNRFRRGRERISRRYASRCCPDGLPPAMGALAYFSLAVIGLDRESHASALDSDNSGRRHNSPPNGCRRKVPDIDLAADGDPASRQMRRDGRARCDLHGQDHHRRRVDLRHAFDEVADREVRRHQHVLTARHANRDAFKRIRHDCFASCSNAIDHKLVRRPTARARLYRAPWTTDQFSKVAPHEPQI